MNEGGFQFNPAGGQNPPGSENASGAGAPFQFWEENFTMKKKAILQNLSCFEDSVSDVLCWETFAIMNFYGVLLLQNGMIKRVMKKEFSFVMCSHCAWCCEKKNFANLLMKKTRVA